MFDKNKKLYEGAMVQLKQSLNQLNSLKTYPITSFDEKAYTSMIFNKDLILCSNRYTWENLPINLTSQELESMFYKYGSLCFFEENGQLIITTYAKNGELDPYGRLTKIQPIDFKGKAYGSKRSVISRNGQNVKEGEKVAVIINDYTTPYTEQTLPRATINLKSTIADQVNVYMQLDNNIKLSIKKALAICENEDQKNTVLNQVQALFSNSLPVVPISSTKGKGISGANLPLELFNFNNTFDTQNYCQTIDYYDKVRRSFDGIPAPDTFEKKERKVVGETEDTTTHTNLVLDDGLMTRKRGLELVKKYIKAEGVESIEVDLNEILKDKEVGINGTSSNPNTEDDIPDREEL